MEHKYLVELIQLIEYACDLSLNDYRYADKTYGIFKIIKNEEKKGYDIIINDNNEKKLQKKDKIEDEKFDDNEEEEEEEEEENKEEEEEEDDDNNSMKGKIKNEKYFIKESPKKSIINFKNINLSNKEKQNNIIYNNNQKNKIIDFNQTYNKYKDNPNIFNDINTINKTPYFNNAPPIPNIVNNNDSQSEDEYDEEEEEENKEKKNEKNIKNYVKCTDCDLVYATIEQMTEHYYNIHNKNKIKDQIKSRKEKTKSKKKEINQNFEQWAEKRKIIKSNSNEKNINCQNKKNNIKTKN